MLQRFANRLLLDPADPDVTDPRPGASGITETLVDVMMQDHPVPGCQHPRKYKSRPTDDPYDDRWRCADCNEPVPAP